MKDRSRRSSLRSQILYRTMIVSLLPLLVLATMALLGLRTLNIVVDGRLEESSRSIANESVAAGLSAESASLGREIDLALTAHVDQVLAWAGEPSVIAGAASGTPSAAPFLAGERAARPEFGGVGYTDRNGVTVGAGGGGLGVNLSTSALWQRAWSGSVGIGEVAIEADSGRTVIPVAVAIDDDQGIRVGVLSTSIDVGFIQSISDNRGETDVEVTVLTVDGRLLAETATDHEPGRIGRTDLDFAELAEGVRNALDEMEGTLVGTDGVYGFAPVELASTLAAGNPGPDETRWLVVAGQPNNVALAPLAGLTSLSEEIDDATRVLSWVVLIVVVLAGLVSVVMAVLLSRHIVGPITRLGERARYVAEHGGSLTDPDLDVDRDNELGDLAESLGSMQRRAIELAGEREVQRRDNLQMLANLGRRSQSLVKRQLRLIDGLERSEEDPERLASLFKLDHLATRMGRSAESLLVIAGQQSPIGRKAAVRVELVVQAALGEIEYHGRVHAGDLESVALAGRLVDDVAHIIAELVDNALSFSPPDSTVEIRGRNGTLHYTVGITDQGMGLSGADLAAANQRLESGKDLQIDPSSLLGLTVVSKLASRRGLSVRLGRADDGGVEALIEIPSRLVEPAEVIKHLPELPSATRRRSGSEERQRSQQPQPQHRVVAGLQPIPGGEQAVEEVVRYRRALLSTSTSRVNEVNRRRSRRARVGRADGEAFSSR